MALLYDATAAGMWVYSHSAFRARTLGPERLRVRPGTILAITHRRETDVPLVCPPLLFGSPMRSDLSLRMSFAARQDLFEPGFFAGFPRSVPAWARRRLWRIDISRYLRVVQLLPVRSAAVIRLVDVVRLDPEVEVDALPGEVAGALRRRAEALGLPEPRRAGDVDRGEYGDLLWRTFTRAELPGEAFEPAWRRHGAAAAGDFRALVAHLARGGVLQLWPEGRPSPDGEIGPIQRGLKALVRRGRPAWIQPVGIAYDPLVPGRTHAFVSFGDPFPPPQEDAEAVVLDRLKLAVPLTAGQFVAAALADGVEPRAEALDEAFDAARPEGRNVSPDLATPAGRRRRLAEAVEAARTARPEDLEFLAREYRSARERG
jgi:1-acyl-sn-glycerol-3-phosphate acyltransferase